MEVMLSLAEKTLTQHNAIYQTPNNPQSLREHFRLCQSEEKISRIAKKHAEKEEK